MTTPARPTLRCLRELGADWGTTAHASYPSADVGPVPAFELDHPLIINTAGRFGGDETDADQQLESISGLTNPPFFKAKSGRWRGAVWIDPENQQAWLVSAGIRAAGEARDFYRTFMRDVEAGGSDQFLPSDADLDLLDDELAASDVSRWELALHRATTRAVAQALDAASAVRIDCPVLASGTVEMPELSIDVERIDEPEVDPSESPAGVTVSMTIRDWSNTAMLRRAQTIVCAAVSPYEDDWDVAPGNLDAVLICTLTEADLDRIRTTAHRPDSETESVEPGRILPTRVSHRTATHGLTGAYVMGNEVRALCGIWFVPRQDPETLEVCAECDAAYNALAP